jgi:DNA-binding GntR family transcriptional regulator
MIDWARIQSRVMARYEVEPTLPIRLKQIILGAIQSGDLAPGTRLKEIELVTALNVSRTPMREALAALKAEQILELDADGLRVRKLAWRDVTSLYEMRGTLDSMAARLAAHRAGDAERTIIDAVCREEVVLIDDSGEPWQLARQNQRFHHAILQASGNQFLVEGHERLSRLMILTGATAYSNNDRVAIIRDEHAAINVAIQQRDPIAAETAMARHLGNALAARLAMLNLTKGGEID